MQLPPSKKQKFRQKSLNLRYGFSSTVTGAKTPSDVFVKDFLKMYADVVGSYYKKNSRSFYKSHINNDKNKSLLKTWFKRMQDADDSDIERYPLPIDSEDDIELYTDMNFWRSVFNTMFETNEFEICLKYYFQTVNGIFLYLKNGKYFSDYAKQKTVPSKKLEREVITSLATNDFRLILGVFIILCYEYSQETKLKRTSAFYKYLGFLECKEDDLPYFNKQLISSSSKFRSVLIDFYPYYLSLIDYLDLPDYLIYNKLLKFVSSFSVNTAYIDTVLKNSDPNNIETFIKKLVKGVLG